MQPQKYSKIGQCKNYKIDKWLEIRVPFHFFERGGEWSPPWGGDTKGGIRAPRGGMARDVIATININRYWKIFNRTQITAA